MNDISSYPVDSAALVDVIKAVDLSEVDRSTCDEFSLLYGRYEALSNLTNAANFLSIICSYRLRPDEVNSPFETVVGSSPDEHFGWKRITEDQFDAIVEVALEIDDSELRARLTDLVWVRLRKHKFGQAAAIAYVASARRLIQAEDILGEKERLYRAVDVAAQLGRQEPLLKEVVGQITEISQSKSIHRCSLANCFRALLRSRSANWNVLHKLARDHAIRTETDESNPIWERVFWELAASFAGQARETDSKREALLKVAKTFETEARNAPMHAVKAHFLEMALHQLRKIDGTQKEKERVHRELLDAQSNMKNEMIPIVDEPVDITELVENSRTRIKGMTKARAIAELILATRFLSKADVCENAQDILKDYPLQHLFSSTKFSSTWKTAAAAPGSNFNSAEIDFDQLFPKMCDQYKYFVPITVNGTIEPMRAELLRAHNVTLDDIESLVVCSPFVPPDRELLFIIGLHAGLQGRFVESLHTLIPQLENLIRWLHSQNDNGVVTSSP